MKITNPLKKIAIIPVYDNIADVVNVLPKFQDNIVEEICVVVDCYTKKGLDKIRKAGEQIKTPVHIIKNRERKGVGYAIRAGIDYAIGKRYDITVVLAGNSKDDPREIPRLLTPILKDDYDYVQGSRFLPGGKPIKTPFLRGLFVRFYPFMWTFLTGIRCTDVTNGFRAYKLSIFSNKQINIWQSWLDHYQLEYYIHYKVLTLDYKTKEVPVTKTYSHKHKGDYSKISPLQDWWKIISPPIYLKLGIKY